MPLVLKFIHPLYRIMSVLVLVLFREPNHFKEVKNTYKTSFGKNLLKEFANSQAIS